MPAVRCKWYTNDGTPVRGGCQAATCDYVHPRANKDQFDSLPPYKSLVRCRFFDDDGVALKMECRQSSRNCRFVHPDDPRWEHAESHILRPPRKFPGPGPIHGSSTSRLGPDEDADMPRSHSSADAVRISLPKLQTGPVTSVQVGVSAQSSVPSESSTSHSKTMALSVNTDPNSVPLLAGRPSVPHTRPSQSPLVPNSATSQSFGGEQRSIWKRRLKHLSFVLDLWDQIRDIDTDIERRKSLQSTGITPALAPSARTGCGDLSSFSERRKVFEDKLNTAVTQLIESDFWPLPISNEATAHLWKDEHFDDDAALSTRLDAVEAQLKARTALGATASQYVDTAIVGIPHAAMDLDHPDSRPLKRRRTSANNSTIPTTSFDEIMTRIDSVDIMTTELEGEALHGERLVEKIDALLEGRLQLTGLSKPRPNSGRPESSHSPAEEAFTFHRLPRQEYSQDILQKLDGDFEVLCIELAQNVATTSRFESQLGKLRSDTELLKESIASQETSQRILQKQQNDLDCKTRELTEEVIKLGQDPDANFGLAKERDQVVCDVTADVQSRVDATLAQLTSTLVSQFEDIQASVLTDLEPTLTMTESIYKAMTLHFEAGQNGS